MISRRIALTVMLGMMVLGSMSLLAVLRLRQGDASSSGQQVISFDVPSRVVEGASGERAVGLGLLSPDRPSLIEWMLVLHEAAADPDVQGLVLRVPALDWNWAQVGEMRDAIRAFQAAGKPVYAVMESGGDLEYMMASAADIVAMPEHARLWLDGLTASTVFLRGTFQLLGIRSNIESVGRYKSAVESYNRDSLSPAAREAVEDQLDDMFDCLVDSISVSRHLELDVVRRRIDEGPYIATEALKLGLVDTLAGPAEAESLATSRGAARIETLDHYRRRHMASASGKRVAWVALEGSITGGRSRDAGPQGRTIGSRTVVPMLQRLARDAKIHAVVLRIDSPGGDAGASDEIWAAVDQLQQVKPVIVSMSGVAASGGYYVGCAAGAIIAHPMTVTGSIGVLGGKVNVLGLYRKLGLNVETIWRGRRAGMLSAFRDFTPDEAAVYRSQLEDSYERFLGRVAAGRRMSAAEVDSVAQGRIWSGNAALELGLVDELGGIATVIGRVRSRLDVDESESLSIEFHPRPRRSWIDHWLQGLLPGESEELSPVRELEAALEVPSMLEGGAALAVVPYRLTIR